VPIRGSRQLQQYPDARERRTALAVVVAVTVVLYYQVSVGAASATRLLHDLDATLEDIAAAAAIASACGALGALVGGHVADRVGRTRLVIAGLGFSAALTLIAFPLCETTVAYGACLCVLVLVVAAALVATPALARDFSPQAKRATAMGLWTQGPVLGAFMVAFVAALTVDRLGTWQSQYVICGAISVAVWTLAFARLRELAPPLRARLVVDDFERQVIGDPGGALASADGGFRRAVDGRSLAAALGYCAASLLHLTVASFSVLLFTLTFGFSESGANGLATAYWVTSAVVMALAGVMSDRLAVRKPLVLVGAVSSLTGTITLIAALPPSRPDPVSMAAVMVLLAAGHGTFAVTWLAAYTETVEQREPGLVAHGLAVVGAAGALCSGAIFLVVPQVVGSVAGDDLGIGARAGDDVTEGWRTWLWICAAGNAVFVASISALRGRWRPAAARQDRLDRWHEVQRALARPSAPHVPDAVD
jgi:MFS family permease